MTAVQATAASERYWRVEKARRVSYLIDSACYFSAFYDAVAQAKHTVHIVGWELDPKLELFHDDERRELPTALGKLIEALVERNDELVVRILLWDYTPLGLGENVIAPLFRWHWPDHQRIRVELHASPAAAASHHQKIVVVDGALAFCGGMDLTWRRWDTSEHRAEDPRRRDHTGTPYYPWHDVQVAVDGRAAGALDDLFAEAWRDATGERLERTDSAARPWPADTPVDLRDAPVGISRTLPELDASDGVREIESLYLHAIRRAEKFIYIENQYLTAFGIGKALAARLEEADGPEVVLVLPKRADGWLEEGLMTGLRAQLLDRLGRANRHNRLRAYSPVVPDLGPAHIDVHSKVLIVDGTLSSVGSANVSNRSMTLDTECNLTIEAGRSKRRADGIRRLLLRLLAEHLDREPHEVESALDRTGSLIATIDGLSRGERCLQPLSNGYPEWMQSLAPSSSLTDPEGPVTAQKIVEVAVPGRLADLTNAPVLKTAVAIGALAVGALGYWWASSTR